MMSHPSRCGLLLCCLFGAIPMAMPRLAAAVEPAAGLATTAQSPSLLRLTFVDPGHPVPTVPALDIRQNGNVFLSTDGRSSAPAVGLTDAELRGLAAELTERHGLLQISTPILWQEIESAARTTGLRPEVAGAATTVIEVQSGEFRHRVECPAVGLLARRYPQIADLQRLAAIQTRLQNVMAVQQVGGGVAADLLAREGTTQLRQSDPQAAPFSAREIAMVRTLSDGSQFVQFFRDARPQPVIVTLTRFPESGPRVSVLNGAAELR